MANSIADKVRDWDAAHPGLNIENLDLHIDYLAKRLFHSYEPTSGPSREFKTRLNKWLENVDDEDQLNLFMLVPHIFYLGITEMQALYLYVYRNNISRWLIEKADISLSDTEIDAKLEAAVRETWFCPITDSMLINSFYNINRIPSNHASRPDWYTLIKLGDHEKIAGYVSSTGAKRLVLLEDFVGSGSQMWTSVRKAATILPDMEILVVPLIICPGGLAAGEQISSQKPNVAFSPGIKLGEEAIIPENSGNNEQAKIRDLAVNTFKKVSGGIRLEAQDDTLDIPPYHPLGYWKTGSLIVKHSNTPNNSLPLLHYQSDTWNALFPRNDR